MRGDSGHGVHWAWTLLGLAAGAGLGVLMGGLALRFAGADAAGLLEGSWRGPLWQDALTRWPWLVCELGGSLFKQALKLIVVPLVFCSVLLSVARLGTGTGIGRMGAKTMIYYALTSLAAIVTGLLLVNWIQPGKAAGAGVFVGKDAAVAVFADQAQQAQGKAAGRSLGSFLDVFKALIPENGFAALADNGGLLGLIVLAIALGLALPRLQDRDAAGHVQGALQGLHDLTLVVVGWVLWVLPVGVGLLLAGTLSLQMARLGPSDGLADLLGAVVRFAAVVLGALSVHALVTVPLILLLVARVSPLRHFKAMMPALLTAFSTSSSNATLPVTIESVRSRAGVSERTAGFVLPLGATVNMDGTALFECVAALFVCQAFGIELPMAQQFMVVLVALLTSIGVAGVPSASIVAIVLILTTVEKQLSLSDGTLLAGLGLLLAIDRPLDMLRTVVNVLGDSAGAVVVARSEGERPLSVESSLSSEAPG